MARSGSARQGLGNGEAWDAVVVGSGATGGWAAKELTESGLRVALLEAGPLFQQATDGLPLAAGQSERQPIQSLCYAHNDYTSHLFVDDLNNPYGSPEEKPYRWIRSRLVGGRLHVWGRVSVRMSDYEFKAASRDGVGEDWPISYADLAPYYERVERYLGVYGTPERLPQMPDGAFLEPPALTAWEEDLKAAIESRWGTRRLTSARLAQRAPEAMLDAALRTGRLMLRPNSVASRVIADPKTGRARSVAFVDALTGHEHEVDGGVIVLCASAIESTRLLLNSATTEHPQGLANSSGALGHYLMDHCCGVGFEGVAPRQTRADERISNGGLIPAFRNITEPTAEFVRGYGVELGVRPPVNGRSRGWRRRRRSSGARFWSHAFGEVLPRFENQVSVDSSRTDAWGIPIAHIECSYGENEAKMAADQLRCLEEILDAGGFQIATANRNLAPPGTSVHEMGTARMGSDPSSSVLNRFNQSWDVKNLFVTDGASFTSGGFQNPTLTMMALTVRACDYIVDKLKRRQL